jgi:hypothetical protein
MIHGCERSKVISLVGHQTSADKSSIVVHRLIHIVTSDDYLSVTLKFGSQLICDEFFLFHHDIANRKKNLCFGLSPLRNNSDEVYVGFTTFSR